MTMIPVNGQHQYYDEFNEHNSVKADDLVLYGTRPSAITQLSNDFT